MLIGITGAKGSGKDTLGDFYRAEGFTVVKNATPLKRMLRTLYDSAGVDVETVERKIEGDLKEIPCDILCGKTPRYAMQTLGTEWREMINTTLWSNILQAGTQKLLERNLPVVCTDVRFEHEADVIRKLGGYLVRVTRPGTGSGDTHSSELEMLSLEVDYVVSNDQAISNLHIQGKMILNDIERKNNR